MTSLYEADDERGAVTTLASGLSCPHGFAIDSNSVYWTVYAGGANGSGSAQKVPK